MLKTKVLVAAETELLRQGILAALQTTAGIHVMDAGTDCEATADLAERLKPDIAIITWCDESADRSEITSRVANSSDNIKVLCLLHGCGEAQLQSALRAGASGCLLQTCSVDELNEAIEALKTSGAYMTHAVAPLLLRHLKATLNLTPKERETLRMIADGFATKQIAGELGVSVKTISAHRSHLMRKLDRHSVAELTKYAILNGLTSVE